MCWAVAMFSASRCHCSPTVGSADAVPGMINTAANATAVAAARRAGPPTRNRTEPSPSVDSTLDDAVRRHHVGIVVQPPDVLVLGQPRPALVTLLTSRAAVAGPHHAHPRRAGLAPQGGRALGAGTRGRADAAQRVGHRPGALPRQH